MKFPVWYGKHQNAEIPVIKTILSKPTSQEASEVPHFLLQRRHCRGAGPFAGVRGLPRWKVVKDNWLLCISGRGPLATYDCCDRHTQCLDSIGNLQILQLSEYTLCAAQPWVVI